MDRAHRPSVALATAAFVVGQDDESAMLGDALASLGIDAHLAVWTDPTVHWDAFDLVVIRSTWDYAPLLEDFLAWVDRVAAATLLLNDAALVRWSTDKRYLEDLAAAGVPVVPSLFVGPGDPVDTPEIQAMLAVEHVVKPTVSAGSADTLRATPDRSAASAAHLRHLVGQGRTGLVQPYVEAVDRVGERALVFLDGEFSHALTKAPLLTRNGPPADEPIMTEEMSVATPTEAELDVARTALAAIPAEVTPLYARVDLLPDESGPKLLELEVAEPSLFLALVEGSADRFAAAIVDRLRSG